MGKLQESESKDHLFKDHLFIGGPVDGKYLLVDTGVYCAAPVIPEPDWLSFNKDVPPGASAYQVCLYRRLRIRGEHQVFDVMVDEDIEVDVAFELLFAHYRPTIEAEREMEQRKLTALSRMLECIKGLRKRLEEMTVSRDWWQEGCQQQAKQVRVLEAKVDRMVNLYPDLEKIQEE